MTVKKKERTFLGGTAELVASGVVGVVKVRFLVGLEERLLVGALFLGCGEAAATEALETNDEKEGRENTGESFKGHTLRAKLGEIKDDTVTDTDSIEVFSKLQFYQNLLYLLIRLLFSSWALPALNDAV